SYLFPRSIGSTCSYRRATTSVRHENVSPDDRIQAYSGAARGLDAPENARARGCARAVDGSRCPYGGAQGPTGTTADGNAVRCDSVASAGRVAPTRRDGQGDGARAAAAPHRPGGCPPADHRAVVG